MPNKKLLLDLYRLHPERSAVQEGVLPEMMKSIGKLLLFLTNSSLRRSVPLILWHEFWLERNQYPENHTRYKRGRLIYADLGAYNIGSETSYRHPCLLLFEGRNWALIAPMTSKKYGDAIALHYDLPHHYPLDAPSTLQLDAIKVIDKRRILGYFLTRQWHQQQEDQTGQGEPIMLDKKDLDAVDELIARHFAPGLHKMFLHARYRQHQLEIENQMLRHQLATLRALHSELESIP
ncbi:type II toxin-antitoxin system PemK/MazF family toxin [Tumebacillus permanentifrigoris]|uniref:mRNA-degrading endonuclease toxin of MazEF toxin-antitoxin module n=1 Tax=Tumebacillus permanentifrigoris TaxID=378543 RepID=A0A316DC45_9BACL|nr:type II toxin-antitoxin system PemK/MazF family toxin [Tumebacillus permanentifrigoris]PWK12765.1 mRNA-degrading endonuclease toxin of MazEF toxin-antitoxin module [Tumebacillus permanentifrigoris]